MTNSKISLLLVFLTLLILSFNSVSALESISGTITDDSSNNLVGVTVSDNASVDTTTSNATGYYILNGYTNLTPYVITGTKAGYVTNTLLVDVDGNMSTQDIELVEKGRLYDVFLLLSNILTNVSTIIGIVIVGVTISIVMVIGAWVLKIIQVKT